MRAITYSFRLKAGVPAAVVAAELEIPGLRLVKKQPGQTVQGHVNSYEEEAYIEVVIYEETEDIREPPIVKPTKGEIEARLRLAGRID